MYLWFPNLLAKLVNCYSISHIGYQYLERVAIFSPTTYVYFHNHSKIFQNGNKM